MLLSIGVTAFGNGMEGAVVCFCGVILVSFVLTLWVLTFARRVGSPTLTAALAVRLGVISVVEERITDSAVGMLAIARARQIACSVNFDCDADRGSDLGDDSCTVGSESDTEHEAGTEDVMGSGNEDVYSCTETLDDELTGSSSL